MHRKPHQNFRLVKVSIEYMLIVAQSLKRVGIVSLPKGWNTFQPLLIRLKMLYSCHGCNLDKILWNKVKML